MNTFGGKMKKKIHGQCSFKPVFQLINVNLKWILILNYELSLFGNAFGWTYHTSDSTMNWNEARDWCQEHYTDLVAIQNKKEIAHLNQTLEKKDNYYWIGIRRYNDVWTWVGTNKTLTNESANWATNEPNNKLQENCVEIYIKRHYDAGKWNDDPCTNVKHALCYKAQCSETVCGPHGECEETIEHYNCSCARGFKGAQCQYAVNCTAPPKPDYGYMNCSGPYGNHNFNSTCELHCAEGFSLDGANNVTFTCDSSGEWIGPVPACQAVTCEAMSKPDYGGIDCSSPYGINSFNSTCTFQCSDGFLLLGSKEVTCNASGKWTGQKPNCSAVTCESMSNPNYGSIECSVPFGNNSFNSTCTFNCYGGFLIFGSKEVTCSASGQWTGKKPICADYKNFIMAVVGAHVIAGSCFVMMLLIGRKKRKKHVPIRAVDDNIEEVVEVTEE
ncbi:E-selectin [Amia ocellicauda]|uniref:E-selectin n=1 Tax=Amia ocellicauda TaxID=2972642 RepID=UPI003464C0C8